MKRQIKFKVKQGQTTATAVLTINNRQKPGDRRIGRDESDEQITKWADNVFDSMRAIKFLYPSVINIQRVK